MIREGLGEHIKALTSGKHKICTCNIESAPYYDLGMYKCQFCGGLLTDLERVRKIIEYNTPVEK